MVNPKHLRLFCSNAIIGSLKGGSGIVFLLFALSFGLAVLGAFSVALEQTEKEASQRGALIDQKTIVQFAVDQCRPAVEFLASEEEPEVETAEQKKGREERAERWAAFLLDDNPALMSAIALIMMIGLPFIAVTGAFNLYSSDIQHKGLRYLLPRTERANIYFGRFLGMAIFATAAMAIAVLVVALYIGLKMRLYPLGDLVGISLRLFLALSVVGLPYMALAAWISGAVDSPFASLTISSILVAVPPVLSKIASAYWERLEILSYLLPWWCHTWLFHPDPAKGAAALAASIAYTAAFLALGYRAFAKRDL